MAQLLTQLGSAAGQGVGALGNAAGSVVGAGAGGLLQGLQKGLGGMGALSAAGLPTGGAIQALTGSAGGVGAALSPNATQNPMAGIGAAGYAGLAGPDALRGVSPFGVAQQLVSNRISPTQTAGGQIPFGEKLQRIGVAMGGNPVLAGLPTGSQTGSQTGSGQPAMTPPTLAVGSAGAAGAAQQIASGARANDLSSRLRGLRYDPVTGQWVRNPAYRGMGPQA